MVSVSALILSVVAHQILGYAWYSPAPWAVPRLKAIGRPATDVSRVDPIELGIDVVGWIVYTLVVEYVMNRANVRGPVAGALFGALLWLGVALPTLAPHYAFMSVDNFVLLVDSANVLVASLLTGAILGYFHNAPSRTRRSAKN